MRCLIIAAITLLFFGFVSEQNAKEFESRVHGMVIVKIKDGKISNWREYWYESELDWKKFTEKTGFSKR